MVMSIGDIVRTSANFVLATGDQYQNIFHGIYDGAGGLSEAAMTDGIETWVEGMYGEIVASMKVGTVPALCSVDQVEFVDGKWEVIKNIGTFLPTIEASSSGDICPNQDSMFITFKTARPKSVGRKFLFSPLEAEQNAGTIVEGTVTKLVAWADDALNDVDLSGIEVLHPGIVRTGVNDFLVFTVAVVTNLTGSQRRRRPGSGA